MDLLLITIVLINIDFIISFGFNGLTNYEILIKKLSENNQGSQRSEEWIEKWIEQPLDHFDENETRTWNMRYFEYTSAWKNGGPVILVLGGEGETKPFGPALSSELATETNAAMFFTEHRYYGKSRPFDNFTTSNLQYLDSTQAIHDNANLLKLIKTDPKYSQSKIVIHGGSYAGNLAAWMKLLFPDLIDAAIASSAPVLAKKDFFEYYEVVGEDFKKYGTPECYKNIFNMFSKIEELFKTESGIKELKEEFNICEDVDFKKNEVQMLFIDNLMTNFAYTAQYGSPNAIVEMCKVFEVSLHRPNFLIWKQGCHDFDFDMTIEYYKNDFELKAWMYQTCNEFGYYQTGNSKKQPFTEILKVDYFITICKSLFGAEFDEKRVDKGVEQSNKKYGGISPNVTKVIFLNGDMDPWSSLSVKKDLSEDVVAKIFPDATHCSDFLPQKSNETKKIFEEVKSIIKSWINV